jgi:xanthine dehydrogenase YagT iron-sulfur-binding subunit
MTGLRGRPAIVCWFPSAWDPSRTDQLAQLNALLAGDVELIDREGDAAVQLLDADGVVQWSHEGPMSPSSVDDLADAVTALHPRDDHRLTPNRREFVGSILAAALLIALKPAVAKAERVATTLAPKANTVAATLNVNGKTLALNIEPRVTLLDALREYAGLTGTKKGCDHGQCGACTVHIDGRRELSCLTFAVMHQRAQITTVEGLAQGDALHPMQSAFIKHDGFQCGYCTPGQLMSATALLREPCGTADADVRECMSGNICRCGAYPGIVAAIQDVRANARS